MMWAAGDLYRSKSQVPTLPLTKLLVAAAGAIAVSRRSAGARDVDSLRRETFRVLSGF